MMTEKGWHEFFTRAPAALRPQTADFRGQKKTVEILDFLDASARHYTESFGVQWTKYRHVQIDRFNGTEASYEHLKMFTLGDLAVLKGKTILEVGSGAGRFTDYLVDLGTRVITVDPSAIFINVALGAANLIPVRGDLFDLPVKRAEVDVLVETRNANHVAEIIDMLEKAGFSTRRLSSRSGEG